MTTITEHQDHDEIQDELYCDNEDLANEWGRIATKCAEEVGKRFNLNVPIAAEYRVGTNWSECH